jgi:hypothetical protein
VGVPAVEAAETVLTDPEVGAAAQTFINEFFATVQ